MGNFLWSSTAPILKAISNSIDALWVLWLRVWLDWGWDVFIYPKVLWDNKTIFFKGGGMTGSQLTPVTWSHWANTAASSQLPGSSTWQDSAPGVCLLDFLASTLLGFPHETLHTSAGSPGTVHLDPCPRFPNMPRRVNSRSEEQLRGRTLSQQWEIVVSGLILSSGIHVGKLYWDTCR